MIFNLPIWVLAGELLSLCHCEPTGLKNDIKAFQIDLNLKDKSSVVEVTPSEHPLERSVIPAKLRMKLFTLQIFASSQTISAFGKINASALVSKVKRGLSDRLIEKKKKKKHYSVSQVLTR